MTYPTCPRCGKGRMVPMLMSGPACDLACERPQVQPAITDLSDFDARTKFYEWAKNRGYAATPPSGLSVYDIPGKLLRNKAGFTFFEFDTALPERLGYSGPAALDLHAGRWEVFVKCSGRCAAQFVGRPIFPIERARLVIPA